MRELIENKMKETKPQLGPLETQFFSWIQLKKKIKIRTGEISEALGLTRKQENKLMSRLFKSGFIIRLCRGLYLVPQKIPPGGKWNPNEYVIISHLMDYYRASYQIGGPTAFNFYSLDGQIPNSVYVYNNQISGKRNIGSISFYFIKILDKRIGGFNKITIPDGEEIKITSLSRTLLDAVYDWSRYNTIPRVYEWINTVKNKDSTVIKELVDMSLKYGNQNTHRRIGYLLETLKIQVGLILKLRKALSSSKSLITWVPNKPARGKIDKKWGLIING